MILTKFYETILPHFKSHYKYTPKSNTFHYIKAKKYQPDNILVE